MTVTSPLRALSRALVALPLALAGHARAADTPSGPLTVAAQGSFFVGGRDVSSETLSTLPAYAPAGTITVDQVYVRYQIPVAPTRAPYGSVIPR